MKKNYFITGATGFLGEYLLRLILKEKDVLVYVLIRGRNKQDAEQKCSELKERISLYIGHKDISNQIILVYGDQEKENLGIISRELEYVTKKINVIYHCAALTGFKLSLADA